jgi:hypothetical protein
MATESEIRSRKHPTEVVWFMLAHGKRLKELKTEDVKA